LQVVPTADPAVFRKTLETSFATLQLEEADAYVDLFAFHGINFPEQLEWIVREGGCMEVVNEYRYGNIYS
jgi:predicted aldo/keto reductase-like oxidoreductase